MSTNSTKKDNIQWKEISANTANYRPPLSKTIMEQLPIEWLVHVKIQDDTLTFLFFDGTEQKFLGTLSGAQELLWPHGFAQYNRSYLANPHYACFEQGMMYVARNPPNIEFDDFIIGRDYLNEVKNRFLSKDEFLMKVLNTIIHKNLSRFF